MPRQGKRRKKRRTEKDEDLSEKDKRETPRCFVVRRGHVGDRIRELVRDFREVMMPNCAKALRESKNNRIEDFLAVAGHFHVSHLIVFTATKAATYMKMARLPQGPTLTFRVESFSTSRDVRASQRRPQGGSRDFTSAPLQVLNGFSAAGEGGSSASDNPGMGKRTKVVDRQLMAEMLRGMFPAIDVPTFNQAECRRTALFHYDRESDMVFFRHFTVSRKTSGIQRGVSKLLRISRLPKLGRREDIADFVLDGGMGASESEMEAGADVPLAAGGQVAVRLTETGPRLKLFLIKVEEGVCHGGVMYHRFLIKTPTQQKVLEERAHQRRALRDRNSKLEAKAADARRKAKKKVKFLNEPDKSDEEGGAVVDDYGQSDDDQKGGKGGKGEKQTQQSPFGWGASAAKQAVHGQEKTVTLDDRPDKQHRRGGVKRKDAWGAKSSKGGTGGKGGKGGSKGGKGGKGDNKVLDRFRDSQKKQRTS